MNGYSSGFSAGIAPQERLDVAQWADRYRVLPAGTAEPGLWRTSRVPYMMEPMRELSSLSDTQRVILMFASQTAKTSTGENWLGYLISHSPGDILVVQPTTARAEWFSKRRIAPMLATSPVFRGLVADERSRDSSNTITMKSFLGGTLTMVGANSPVGLKSDSIQYLFLDEVDGYPADVGEEGDPIALAEMRTITFPRSKILITSTPTVAETSRVEREYLASDQRKYFVPCPECDWMQELRWRGSKNDEGKEHREYRLVWADEAHTVACYICEDCGVLIEERNKTRMLEAGEWRAQAPNDGRVKGYHLSALYSPYGWKSWRKILEDFERAAKDAPLLKTFVNSTLAETWEENYSMRIDADGIAARAEMYSMLTVPEGGLVITAGIDVQDNRLEIVQRAWGEGEESWLVNYSIIHGDPGQPALWAQALDVLDMVFQVEGGGRLTTLAAAVDTGGHYTHEAYAFCRQHRARRVLAVKGSSQHGKPAIGKPALQDINFKNQTIKNGIKLWPLGTDTIKSVIYGRLKNPDGGPGSYHWPIGLHADYFKQLTAEKQAKKYVGGFPKLTWVKKSSDANEALDCFDAKTEILTDNGWKYFSDLSGQERLATVNLDEDIIEYQAPVALIAKPYTGPMISIAGKRADILVTPNHRMVAHKKIYKNGKWNLRPPAKVVLAKDLTIHHSLKAVAGWRGEDFETISIPASYGLWRGGKEKEIEPVRKIDAGDMAELCGWYVSEGYRFKGRSKTQGNVRHRVQISQNPGAKQDEIKKLLDRLPWKWRVDNGVNNICSSKQIFAAVNDCGDLAANKRVPAWIKNSSPRIIRRFLDAAILGDGWIQSKPGQRKHRTYATISPLLADDIQELFIKIGCAANIKIINGKKWAIDGRHGNESHPQYHVSECKSATISLDGGGGGKRELIAKEVNYSGMVYCATVPNGTLICRRYGKSFIAGNCEVYAYAALQYLYTRTNRVTFWDQMQTALENQPPSYQPPKPSDPVAAKRRGVRSAGIKI